MRQVRIVCSAVLTFQITPPCTKVGDMLSSVLCILVEIGVNEIESVIRWIGVGRKRMIKTFGEIFIEFR